LRKKTPRGSDELKPGDYRLLADFRYLLRRFLAFSEEAAREAGLTSQQHQALLAIKAGDSNERMTIGDLANRLSIRHHSAVGLVNRLVLAKLVARDFDPSDRRRVTLALTGKSETSLQKLTTAHRRELRRLAPVLKGILMGIE
jgi:DNA-binding MarR family transcriptional regulator